MNDRYGVDPCAAAEVSDLTSLLRNFGPEHGRFIFEFPPDWAARAKDHHQAAKDFERKMLTEWLLRARRSLLPTKARYSAVVPWAKNAESLTGATGLIGPAGSRPPCRALNEVLLDPNTLPNCQGARIPRTPAAYVDAARPLLQISRKVVLVDRFLRLRQENAPRIRSESHFRSLKALVQAAHEERRVEVFELVVSQDAAMIHVDGGAGFEAELDVIRSELGTDRMKIETKPLSEKHRRDQHARYLLGNECGLRFDWGFDVARDKDSSGKNDVAWVSSELLQDLLAQFM